MMALSNIPSQTLEKQRRASDPAASVWVSANAGSGKTHVLAQRVVRLLLRGAPPSKILCLTFTKAAAANMAMRVFDTLALWTRLDDAALRDAIVATGAPDPSARDRVEARKLFARTVETPGGLKIQTIHAFCERLLHLFPFEANAPARFKVADEIAEAELMERARRDVLIRARVDPGLREKLARVTQDCSAQAFEALIKEAMSRRARVRDRWPKDHSAGLRKALGLAPGRDLAAIRDEMIERGIAPARWGEIAAFLELGGEKDRTRARAFRQAVLHRANGDLDSCLGSYLQIFFNQSDDEKTKSLIAKALAKQRPDIETELCSEQERLDALRAEQKAAATLERTVALAGLIDAIFRRYEAMKAARGILDFDDLIAKTLALLERSEASWVLYKLDAGIDHVLVDEAQDTSAAQWRILERLTGDFAVGAGRAAGTRTFFRGGRREAVDLFVPGRGAGHVPCDAARIRTQIHRRRRATFAHVRLTQSFRSAPGVLSAIDRVFALPETSKRSCRRIRCVDAARSVEGKAPRPRRNLAAGRRRRPRRRERLAPAARYSGREGSGERRRAAGCAEDRGPHPPGFRRARLRRRARRREDDTRGRHSHSGAHARAIL